MSNTHFHNPRHLHTGFLILTLAYPLTRFLVSYIPNPFIPTADIALNMIFPILAGYFYGPVSGLLAGLVGTGLSALIEPNIFEAMSIFPHTFMGAVAGLVGTSRSHFAAAATIIVGHALNILFYWRFDLLTFENINVLLLGLMTETTIDIVAIILGIVLLQKWLYQEKEQRW